MHLAVIHCSNVLNNYYNSKACYKIIKAKLPQINGTKYISQLMSYVLHVV